MSHVAKIEAEFRDLEALKAAAKRLGAEWLDQHTFAWYGQHVGDYPLPQGFAAEDMGRCDVGAIRFPGARYEVGVCKRRDGKPGYTLLWDFWRGGYGLREQIGAKGEKIVQAYSVEASKRAARRAGYSVTEATKQDGSVVLTVQTGA